MSKRELIKSFLGIKSKKSEKLIFGGVESIQPGSISGWAYCKITKLTEIRLLTGPNLICSASINIERDDVNNQLGVKGNFGFNLLLPTELPPLSLSESPRLIVMSADGNITQEIFQLNQKEKTQFNLKKAISSEMRGAEGHLDGLMEDGFIHGWCGKRGDDLPVRVWLNSEGLEPREVLCDVKREGMKRYEMHSHTGFKIDPAILPEVWIGKKVFMSYDKEGFFKLPENAPIIIPKLNLEKISTNIKKIDNKNSSLDTYLIDKNFDEQLEANWRVLNQFEEYLNSLENLIDKTEKINNHSNKKTKKGSRWFKRN